jgi:hypothetical protein
LFFIEESLSATTCSAISVIVSELRAP